MTLVDQISAMLGTTEPQWRAERLQVVNWGGFSGHASAEFSPKVTVISGQSGAGKSTLLDAYIALMMPPNVAFNGASNDSGGGRARSAEQRNLISYLRGKLDDTLEDGEVVDHVMRGSGEPTWGAVAMTFITDSGERCTAMRAYYVPARATRPGEFLIRSMVIDDAFDLRDLKEFAHVGEDRFLPRQLKARWDGLRTYDSYPSFAQALFMRLGIGAGGDGANALKLLARIQASEDIPTVDKLYKDLVIERPDSYEKADAAIEHFDRLEDVYREMVTAQDRADLLGPITEACASLVTAQEAISDGDELGDLRSENTPAGLWRMRRHSQVLDVAVEQNRADAREHRAAVSALAERESSLQAQLESAKKARSDAGGDMLEVLESQIGVISEKIKAREARRAKLVTRTMILQRPLSTQPEFEHCQQAGRAFLADFADEAARLEAQRDAAKGKMYPLSARVSEIRTELESLRKRTGRVNDHLDGMRRRAAAVSGLPIPDLPFVAELIDVMPDETHWRTAIETALHSSARTMLVPLEHLEHFSKAIDPENLKGRLNFEGVVRSAHQNQPILDVDSVAGKLLFKDSPYQGWVAEHVAHPSRNALCVSGPDQLDGRELRITPKGQTRKNRRGAHGRQSERNVIGFDNADLREELEAEQRSLDAQLEALDGESKRIAEQIKDLGAIKSAFERVLDETWADLDVETISQEKLDLIRRHDEIRDNSDVLAELDRQIAQLKEDLETVQGDRHLRKAAVTALDKAHEGYVKTEDEVNPVITRLENDGEFLLRDELSRDLDRMWVHVLAGEPESPESFDRQLNRLAAELEQRTEAARVETNRMTQQIEGIFRRYLKQWEDANLGATIEYYDDFAAILDEIVRSGLHERRDEWRRRLLQWSGEHLQQLASALSSAIDEIDDRLHPINQILRTLPFGPTEDTLFIDMRRLHPDAVVRFKKDLKRHASTSTAGLPDDELGKRFKELQRFMAQIRRKDDARLPRELAATVDRDRLLDVRRHVEITAQRLDDNDDVLSVYSSLRGKSGGEMQELIAFIVGSALRFQLGDQLRSRPRFAPVFLDEGFIKADGQFTSRAVRAWRGLGFQLIVGAPVDKAPALEQHADIILQVTKNLATHRSYVMPIRGVDERESA